MIEHVRFMASKAISKDAWLEARRLGVTATQVARAVLWAWRFRAGCAGLPDRVRGAG